MRNFTDSKWSWFWFSSFAYLTHWLIFQYFLLWRFVDGDQLVEVDMVRRISELNVPEPYFWGQAYNFPVETWIAAPMAASGLRADLALTIVTGLLCYAPFVIAQLVVPAGNRLTRILVLAIPLAVPVSWWAVVLLPQAYGQRAALACIGVLATILSRAPVVRSIGFIAFGVCLASSPTVFIFLPLMIWVQEKRSSWWQAPALVSVGYLGVSALGLFYALNPSFVVHQTGLSIPSSESFMELLSQPDRAAQLAIVFSFFLTGWAIGTVLPLGTTKWGIPLKSMWLKWSVSFTGIIIIGGGFLLIDKTGDASNGLAFSFYRFWGAIPFAVLIFALVWATKVFSLVEDGRYRQIGKAQLWSGPLKVVALTLFVTVGTLGLDAFSLSVQSRELITAPSPVPVMARSKLSEECRSLQSGIDSSTYVQLTYRNDALAYGCYAINGLNVVNGSYERRTWLTPQLRRSGFSAVRR